MSKCLFESPNVVRPPTNIFLKITTNYRYVSCIFYQEWRKRILKKKRQGSRRSIQIILACKAICELGHGTLVVYGNALSGKKDTMKNEPSNEPDEGQEMWMLYIGARIWSEFTWPLYKFHIIVKNKDTCIK